jgi:hypothetical protein
MPRRNNLNLSLRHLARHSLDRLLGKPKSPRSRYIGKSQKLHRTQYFQTCILGRKNLSLVALAVFSP